MSIKYQVGDSITIHKIHAANLGSIPIAGWTLTPGLKKVWECRRVVISGIGTGGRKRRTKQFPNGSAILHFEDGLRPNPFSPGEMEVNEGHVVVDSALVPPLPRNRNRTEVILREPVILPHL
jgi:hypothetical protein